MNIVYQFIHQPRLLTEPRPVLVGTIPAGIMDDAGDEGGTSIQASHKTATHSSHTFVIGYGTGFVCFRHLQNPMVDPPIFKYGF